MNYLYQWRVKIVAVFAVAVVSMIVGDANSNENGALGYCGFIASAPFPIQHVEKRYLSVKELLNAYLSLSKSKTFRVSFFGKPVAPVASSPLNEVEGPIKDGCLRHGFSHSISHRLKISP